MHIFTVLGSKDTHLLCFSLFLLQWNNSKLPNVCLWLSKQWNGIWELHKVSSFIYLSFHNLPFFFPYPLEMLLNAYLHAFWRVFWSCFLYFHFHHVITVQRLHIWHQLWILQENPTDQWSSVPAICVPSEFIGMSSSIIRSTGVWRSQSLILITQWITHCGI